MRAAACTALASCVLALVACGGDEDVKTNGRSVGPPPTGSRPAQSQKLVNCLRQHGVSLPRPGQGGGPPSLNGKTRRAIQACGKYLPQGAPPGGAGGAPPGGFAPPGGSTGSNGG